LSPQATLVGSSNLLISYNKETTLEKEIILFIKIIFADFSRFLLLACL